MAGMQKVHVIKNLNSKVSWVEKNLKINKWERLLKTREYTF